MSRVEMLILSKTFAEQSGVSLQAGPAKVHEQNLLNKYLQTATDKLVLRKRVLIQQYLGFDGTHNDVITFLELAVLLNYK